MLDRHVRPRGPVGSRRSRFTARNLDPRPLGALLLGALAGAGCGDDGSSSSAGAGGADTGASSSTTTGSASTSTGTGGGGGAGPERVAGDPLFGAGERLRVRLWDGGAGAVFQNGLVDSALEADCSFQLAEDGSARCAPYGVAYYADAGCTEVLSFPRTGCSGGTGFAAEYLPAAEACAPTPVRIWRATEQAATGDVYAFDGAECFAVGTVDDFDDLRVAEQVAPTELVAAEEVTEVLDDRIARTLWLAEDGAYQVRGVVDRLLERSCAPSAVADGESGPCTPLDLAYHYDGDLFADAACTEPAGGSFGECGFEPTHGALLSPAPDGCSLETDFFELGETVETPYGGDACAPVEDVTARRFAGPLDLGGLPQVAGAALGTGVVVAPIVTAAGAHVATRGIFRDTARGSCFPQRTSEGLRCIPTDATGFGGLFADDACEIPVAIVYGSCAPLPELVLRSGDPDSCGVVVTVAAFELGAAHEGSVFVADGVGGCQALELSPEEAPYLVGPEVPLSSLPAIDERIE